MPPFFHIRMFNPIALIKAKIVYNFDLFECKRVNKTSDQCGGRNQTAPEDQFEQDLQFTQACLFGCKDNICLLVN